MKTCPLKVISLFYMASFDDEGAIYPIFKPDYIQVRLYMVLSIFKNLTFKKSDQIPQSYT